MKSNPLKKVMGRNRFKFHEEHYPYFITHSVVGGVSIFDDPLIAKIVLDSMKFMNTEFKVKIYAYVIMHHHVHLIVEAEDIVDKIRKFKSYTARRILDSLKERNRSIIQHRIKQARVTQKVESQYQLWQEGSHPIQIDSDKKMESCIEYIHYNPVNAGFVEKPECWCHSSVRAYLGTKTNEFCSVY